MGHNDGSKGGKARSVKLRFPGPKAFLRGTAAFRMARQGTIYDANRKAKQPGAHVETAAQRRRRREREPTLRSIA